MVTARFLMGCGVPVMRVRAAHIAGQIGLWFLLSAEAGGPVKLLVRKHKLSQMCPPPHTRSAWLLRVPGHLVTKTPKEA